MAESDTGSGGSWWGGWLQAAKEKSFSAIEMIKKDLEEFSNTMQHDTGEAVAKTSESLRETLKTENTEAARDRLKHGISSFLDGLTKLLVVEAEDKNLPVEIRKTTDPIFDRAKARLNAIQVDPSTYCNTPSGPIEKFEEWVKSFDMDSKKGEISELLVSQVEVRGLYTRLVPSEISHADFWKRYFYKVHQLQIDEARKLALMKRAEQSEKKEDSINWDDEDSSADDEVMKSSPKNKTENNRLPTLPQDSVESKEKNKTSVTKTETNMVLKTECETKQNNETSSDSTGVPAQNDSHIQEVNKDVSSANTDSKQTMETVSEGSADIQIDNKLSSDKTCTNEESEIKENSELLNTEKKKDNLETTDSQVETKSTGNESEKHEKTGNNCDKTETAPSVESEMDTVKQLSANEDETNVTDEIKTKVKGDVVVVNPDRESPSTESTKGSADDDWERDFDVELTEEDLKAADEIAKKLNLSSTDYTKLSAEMDEDWESWE